MKQPIRLTMSLSKIIRIRPKAVELLERAGGCRVWEGPEISLWEFARETGAEGEALVGELLRIPPARADADWQSLAAYHLVDFLTGEHEEFRERLLPDLHDVLDREAALQGPDDLVPVQEALRHFERSFRAHMEEEEEFLFPKIMRNEACFRFPELSPEPYKGSVNLYLVTGSHPPEEVFRRALAEIQGRAKALSASPTARDRVGRILAALEAFGARLDAHAALEEDALFPRAGRLEQELYETTAPGISRYPDRD